MSLFNLFFGNKVNTEEIAQALNNGAVVIDVRTPQEFGGGHPKNAINIPVNTIQNSLDKIKKYNKQIVVCCASGGRSASAAKILRDHGMNVIDAGPWQNVKN